MAIFSDMEGLARAVAEENAARKAYFDWERSQRWHKNPKVRKREGQVGARLARKLRVKQDIKDRAEKALRLWKSDPEQVQLIEILLARLMRMIIFYIELRV